MNARNIFISLVLLVGLIVLISPATFAQRAWYVNNSSIGNDGRNGSSATIPSPDDGVTGPKKTLGGAPFGAIAAANAGDTIYVANTTIAYGTGTGEPATIPLTKRLMFRSTGGTVEISSLVQVNNANADPDNTVIFDSGEFKMSGGLTLTVGVLTNSADLLTVSGTVTRSIAAATVTSQLKYTGTVDFVYAGGAAITAGNEFPAAGTFNSLTTNAAGTNLTLKTTSATMTGVITTTGAGTLNLGGNALTITNTGAATHAFGGGAVSNGTLVLSLGGGDVTLNGAVAIPGVTVSTSTATARTLAIAQPTSLTGPLTVSGKASVTSSAALITVGAASFAGDEVIVSGIGNVTLSGTPTTVNGNVVSSGTGIVQFAGSAATVNGNVLLNSTGLNVSNTGRIDFAGSGAVTVNGNVTNSAGVVLGIGGAVTRAGTIYFPDQITTITGTLKVDGTLSGTAVATPGNDNYTENILINLNASAALVTVGTVVDDSKLTATGIATSTVSTNGQIWFQSTTGNIVATGGFVNSSNMPKILGTNVSNGIIQSPVRTTGTIGTIADRTGLVSNISVSDQPSNGNIYFRTAATGAFYGTSVSQGAVGAGGIIYFGNHAINVTGNITNARTATGSDILSVGGPLTVGGYVLNSGKSIISLDLSTAAATAAITGRVENSGDGTITFPGANTGTITMGGLVVSKGTVSIPATHDAVLAINGAVDISGGTASLLSNGGDAIVITGPASFTGGTVTTTGRTAITINSTLITFGGASSNTTFSTAATAIVVGNPSPTSLVTFTIGTFNPTIPGVLEVNNTTGLAEAVRFTGGSMTVVGNLLFTSGTIVIAEGANISVQGNFTNTAGYTTPTLGRVTLAGAVARTFGGAGIYGNIEFKNVAGMATSTTVTLAGTIYLTSGVVSNAGGAITINNSTVLPTVVLNAGTFNATPTYISNVNITYIGTDKSTGFETPSVATKLQNLTVATTNGASAGHGIVTLSASETVNGIITINSGQALSIPNTYTLTMKGSSIVLNGDIINIGNGNIAFSAAAGTIVAGTGYLPNVVISAGSVGNIIGAKAIINQLLGTDGVYAGAADFAPTTGTAQGSLTFISGTNSATVTLTGITDGSMVGAVTTAGTGDTLNLGGNLVVAGTLTHAAGTINVGTFTLEQRGAAITLGAATVPATFTGTGLLKFYQKDATTNTSFTLTSAATTEGSVIGINVELNNADADDAQDNLILAGGPLTISRSLTITDGELVLGQNLTLTGSAATITENGKVSGAGVLTLNATTPPMVFTFTGAPSISNLTISNNVNLVSGTPAGTGLTVTTAFNHKAGVLNFGDMDLTFQTAFTRTAGTAAYQAGTGYMILDGAAAMTIVQGSDGFSVPNLKITASAANNVALTGTGGGTVTVTKVFDLANVAQTFTTNGKLTIANLATVNYTSGSISAAPTYAGTITLVGKSFATGATFPALIWPASASLVTTLTINGAATGNTIALPGSRTVNAALDLLKGTLTVPTGNTLTVVDSSLITVDAGVLSLVGSVVYGNGISVRYVPSAANYLSTGTELPPTIRNLSFTRLGNTPNKSVTLTTPVTITGTLSIKNNLVTNVGAPITLNGDLLIAKDAFANATVPITVFGDALTLSGTANTAITVPSTPATGIPLSSLEISKATSTTTVTLSGGNLDMSAGIVTFTKGLLKTDSLSYIWINAQVGLSGQGFVRNVAPGDLSHVVGNVKKTLKAGTIQTFGRNEFPVGSLVAYCPVAITIINTGGNVSLGVNVLVNQNAFSPTGIVGLPIKDGVSTGVDISRYAALSWGIKSDISLGNTAFDLELTDPSFTAYDDITKVRIIRRIGTVLDITNEWSLQGLVADYDNFVVAGSPTVINHNSIGGIRTQGAIFTYGMKTNINPPTIADVIIGKVGTAYVPNPFKLSLAGKFTNGVGTYTYIASSTNSAVATVAVVHSGTTDTLKVTPLTDGNTLITVKATDANNDFATASFNVRVQSTGIEPGIELPKEFSLNQNYPNPFNPTTNIKFGIPQNSSVKITIYDMLGREVATLVNTNYTPGYYTVPFNASKLASGMYIYRMTSQSLSGDQKMFTSTKKLMLLK